MRIRTELDCRAFRLPYQTEPVQTGQRSRGWNPSHAAVRGPLLRQDRGSERVGQRPGREGIGGKALMHQGQGRFQPGIAQVGVVHAEIVRQNHALVDQGSAHDLENSVR